jgi:hypothetical protein
MARENPLPTMDPLKVERMAQRRAIEDVLQGVVGAARGQPLGEVGVGGGRGHGAVSPLWITVISGRLGLKAGCGLELKVWSMNWADERFALFLVPLLSWGELSGG